MIYFRNIDWQFRVGAIVGYFRAVRSSSNRRKMFAAVKSLHHTVARRVTSVAPKPRPSPPQVQQLTRRHGSDMPVPQSQNAQLWYGHSVQKEGWEEYLYFYYAVGFLLQVAVFMAAPETSIESWARSEAKARLYLASKGQTEFEFGKHYQDVVEAEHLELWSQFAAKAVTPGEDDDDDDDDEEEVSTFLQKIVGNTKYEFLHPYSNFCCCAYLAGG
jgi:hypothetical protein